MINRHIRIALFVGALAVGAVLPQLATSAAATKPNPPSSLCIGDDCASQSASTNGYKWHPGQYMWLDPNTSQSSQMSAIDQLSSDTSVEGVQVLANWAALEGATPGDYSAGFALVDAYIARLASLKVPKRLMLGLNDRKFGSPKAAGTRCADAIKGLLPAYIATLSDGGCAVALPGASGGLSVMAMVWDAPVMDRLIALSKAYAKRYDQNPLFEMFAGNGETALAAPPNSGYSAAAYNTQLKRWFDASKPVWPHTQLRLVANWAGSDSQMTDLIAYTTAGGGVVVGGPDTTANVPGAGISAAQRLFAGATGGSRKVPWIAEVQMIGVNYGKYSPAQMYDFAMSTMHSSYMVWIRNTWMGDSTQMWSTGILPFIQSVKGSVDQPICPSTFANGCDTD